MGLQTLELELLKTLAELTSLEGSNCGAPWSLQAGIGGFTGQDIMVFKWVNVS